MKWFLQALGRYADFRGRARRKEFWYFSLFSAVISLGSDVLDRASDPATFAEFGMGYVGLLTSLVLLVPGLSVAVRRLHDTGRSGWWLLLSLIPVIGWFVLLVFAVTESHPGSNAYGSNPKDETASVSGLTA